MVQNLTDDANLTLTVLGCLVFGWMIDGRGFAIGVSAGAFPSCWSSSGSSSLGSSAASLFVVGHNFGEFFQFCCCSWEKVGDDCTLFGHL